MGKMKIYEPRAYWAQRAREDGKKYVTHKWHKNAFSDQLSAFTEAMEVIPNVGTLLDFGCGVGRFAPFASHWVDRYEGVDITKEGLVLAPEIENGGFTHLEKDEIPFPDDHFDSAMALTVLQHIVSDDHFALWTSELNRVVKPGGHFFLIESSIPRKSKKIGLHMNFRTAEELAEALGSDILVIGTVSAEFENSHYSVLARKHGIS